MTVPTMTTPDLPVAVADDTGRTSTSVAGPAPAARTTPRVRLLGGFGLWLDDVEPRAAPVGQRLVAWLALQERPSPRARVAGELWPRATEGRAQASLRSTLWRLRDVAPDLVVDHATGLRLAADAHVDTRSLTSASRALLAGEERPEDVDALIGLLSGDLLPGWYDDWLLYERERLRQLSLHAMDALCRILVRAGDLGRAVEVGVLAVRREPLRESAHRNLILAHLAEDNVGEARRQYDRLVELLDRELGIPPSPRTRCLLDRAADDGSWPARRTRSSSSATRDTPTSVDTGAAGGTATATRPTGTSQ